MGKCCKCKKKKSKCCCEKRCYSSCNSSCGSSCGTICVSSCNSYGNSCYNRCGNSCGNSCNPCCNPCFKSCVKTRCGFISLVMNVTALPTTYTAAGEIIVLTYVITNFGSDYFGGYLSLCTNLTGTQVLSNVVIGPGLSYTTTQNYTITANDVLNPTLTLTSVVKGDICGKTIGACAPNVVLTRV